MVLLPQKRIGFAALLMAGVVASATAECTCGAAVRSRFHSPCPAECAADYARPECENDVAWRPVRRFADERYTPANRSNPASPYCASPGSIGCWRVSMFPQANLSRIGFIRDFGVPSAAQKRL